MAESAHEKWLYCTDWTARLVRVGGVDILPAGTSLTLASLKSRLGDRLFYGIPSGGLYRPLYGMAIGQSYGGSTPAQGMRFDGGSISFLPASMTMTVRNYLLRVVDSESSVVYSGQSTNVNIVGGVAPRLLLQASSVVSNRNGFQGYGGVLCHAVLWTDTVLTHPTLTQFSVFLGFKPITDGTHSMSAEEVAYRIMHKTW